MYCSSANFCLASACVAQPSYVVRAMMRAETIPGNVLQWLLFILQWLLFN